MPWMDWEMRGGKGNEIAEAREAVKQMQREILIGNTTYSMA
jgi:hypothetical protein